MTTRLFRFAAVCVIGSGCASLDPILATDGGGADASAGFEAGADTGAQRPDAAGTDAGATNPDAGKGADVDLPDAVPDAKKGGPPDAMPDVVPDVGVDP